jgi:hypothetical protein
VLERVNETTEWLEKMLEKVSS